jgi:hypothetical protein
MPWLVAGLFSLLSWSAILLSVAWGIGQESERVGRAPLFLLTARFDVRGYLESAPAKSHTAAILWDVPRRRLKNLTFVVERSPVDTVLVALLNETCVRNGVCEPRDALFGYTIKSLRRAAQRGDSRLKALVQREARAAYVGVQSRLEGRRMLINPLLETSLSSLQWDTVASWVQEVAPDVELVWNPLFHNSERPSRATFVELHGSDIDCGSRGDVIANLDGSILSVELMRKWLKETEGCRDSLLWAPADNCRNEEEKAFVAPSLRRCRQTFGKIREVLK